MKKALCIIIATVMCILCGCRENVNGVSEEISRIGSADVSGDASAEISGDEPEEVSHNAPEKPLSLVFMGNSLTKCSGVASKAELFAKGKYAVTDLSEDGCTLAGHINRIEMAEVYDHSEVLKNADIVVFQEYGGGTTDDETLEELITVIKELRNGKKTEFYYMIPHVIYAYTSLGGDGDAAVMSQLKRFPEVTPLPLGMLCQFVAEKYYGNEIAYFLYDGLHPSELGAAFAAMAFGIIVDSTGEPTVEWSTLSDAITDALPGSSPDEKNEFVRRVYAEAYDYYFNKVLG